MGSTLEPETSSHSHFLCVAAAHGGQVACEEALLLRVISRMEQLGLELGNNSGSTAEEPSSFDLSSEFQMSPRPQLGAASPKIERRERNSRGAERDDALAHMGGSGLTGTERAAVSNDVEAPSSASLGRSGVSFVQLFRSNSRGLAEPGPAFGRQSDRTSAGRPSRRSSALLPIAQDDVCVAETEILSCGQDGGAEPPAVHGQYGQYEQGVLERYPPSQGMKSLHIVPQKMAAAALSPNSVAEEEGRQRKSGGQQLVAATPTPGSEEEPLSPGMSPLSVTELTCALGSDEHGLQEGEAAMPGSAWVELVALRLGRFR